MGYTLSGMSLSGGFTLTGAPGAPIIGTATSTGATTATVAFTQPIYNGGLTISSYTAVSTPGGIIGTLSQAGSGTITVTGLTAGTNYTFTVYATNSAGNSESSTASNQITTDAAVTGQIIFNTVGATTWTVPTGVTSVSVVLVGGSGGMRYNTWKYSGGGGGGALTYGNNLSVTPGEVINIQIGRGSTDTLDATPSWFRNTGYLYAGSGACSTTGQGFGGTKYYGGGGGAGGYSGNGGAGGSSNTPTWIGGAGGVSSGSAKTGGGDGGRGGDGGAGAPGTGSAAATGSGGGGGGNAGFSVDGTGGGGVDLYGQGSDGSSGGFGGSGGSDGSYQQGGFRGGAAPGGPNASGGTQGGIRIIWPGNTRYFPSTNTADV